MGEMQNPIFKIKKSAGSVAKSINPRDVTISGQMAVDICSCSLITPYILDSGRESHL